MSLNLVGKTAETVASICEEGLYKAEKELTSPQSAKICVGERQENFQNYTTQRKKQNSDDRSYINLCANNYLGLANHPDIIKAVHAALDDYGYGMASVRFICGTQDLHKALEAELSAFLCTEDTILYASCFDANTGFFETLLGSEDAIISDALNHASIIDGVRLCKAQRLRYGHNDMQDLEHKLQEASGARFRMIATDGVFSMDGVIANLPEIFALARKYDCMVLVDDSHAVGFVGKDGRGTPEFFGLDGDERLILSGTLGKALGGGSGGYIAGSRDVISLLRQRSRPYLFSNSLAPPVVAASLEALRLVRESPHLRNKLHENAVWFRERLTGLGFDLKGDGHPIIPVMTYDSNVSQRFAELLMDNGVYVISFSYPVVPREKARVRTQVSASHEIEDLAFAADMFHKAGQICGLLSQ